MSDETEIKKKNRELELERALRFFEMKSEIAKQLREYLLNLYLQENWEQREVILKLIKEIESI